MGSKIEHFLRTKQDYVPSSGCFASMVVSTFEVVRAWVKRKKRFGDSIAIAKTLESHEWARTTLDHGLNRRKQSCEHMRGI